MSNNDEFCIKNEELCIKNNEFVFKMMSFAGSVRKQRKWSVRQSWRETTWKCASSLCRRSVVRSFCAKTDGGFAKNE